MSDVKHTALPWVKEYDCGDGTPVIVYQCRDICRVDLRDGEANADYIIRAANAYPALVEALERIANWELSPDHAVDNQMQDVARAALAQAQGDE